MAQINTSEGSLSSELKPLKNFKTVENFDNLQYVLGLESETSNTGVKIDGSNIARMIGQQGGFATTSELDELADVVDTKQENLVSRENIKTINGVSLLGAGNISVGSGGNVFIAEYGVTTFDEITEALDGGQEVIVKQDNSVGNNYYYRYRETSSNLSTGEKRYYFEKLDDLLLHINTVVIKNNNTWSMYDIPFQPKLTSGTNIKTVNGNSLLGSGNINIYLSDWVISYSAIATNQTIGTGIAQTYDLTSYLPNDSSKYEVMYGITAQTEATANASARLSMTSDIITDSIPIIKVITRTSSVAFAANSSTMLIGTGRTISIKQSIESGNHAVYSLELYAYRRVQ